MRPSTDFNFNENLSLLLVLVQFAHVLIHTAAFARWQNAAKSIRNRLTVIIFEKLAKQLLSVPKSVIDKRQAEYEKKKAAKRRQAARTLHEIASKTLRRATHVGRCWCHLFHLDLSRRLGKPLLGGIRGEASA